MEQVRSGANQLKGLPFLEHPNRFLNPTSYPRDNICQRLERPLAKGKYKFLGRLPMSTKPQVSGHASAATCSLLTWGAALASLQWPGASMDTQVLRSFNKWSLYVTYTSQKDIGLVALDRRMLLCASGLGDS